MTQPLHLKAYAKVNLGLDVLRRREDGYHEVRMIMQTVKLFDYITLQKNTCGQIRLSSNLPYLPLNEKNLVYRAIDTIRTAYNISDGVDAAIEKHIPVAADPQIYPGGGGHGRRKYRCCRCSGRHESAIFSWNNTGRAY